MSAPSRIVAVLGPTNTGKTHYAIDRMLGHRTGIIGLPLRLLAREVYDKIVAIRGPSVVALVTGEERIVPPRTKYWVCTVEAMPEGMGADFVAVDEIQLCADPERGHVFTDRLLRSRGLLETIFMGAGTMRGPIQALVPEAQFVRRERMSELVYGGTKKISRMPPRSAIVGFSVENVYAIAELLRRQKGGAAVVMGALSPRTRNAQVELYQNGEVDYLVATDAIGMGLNLDIDHVAFSSLTKFDGRRMRALAPNELAQIAGRAGRGMSHGSFGVTGEAPPLDEGMAQAIMEHRFTPLKKLNWRNAALRFGTVDALIHALEESPDNENLLKARPADDLNTLKTLSQIPEVMARASDGESVRLLWDVCRIPDFRGISHSEHANLLEVIFNYLHQNGALPDDWLARQIKRIDRTDGDIDALSKRLAYIRTWTYVAQRRGWVKDENHWRGETRAVEDRVSDALHERLTQRFVDRRTSVLLRRLKQKEALLAEVNDKGEVTVGGEFVGRLEGFRFSPDKSAQGAEAKALKSASLQALAPQFHLRADRFYNAPDTEIDYTEQGGLMWGEHAVGKLVAGAEPLKPMVEVFVDEAAGPDVAQKVQRRLQHFIDRKVAALFEPLTNLQRDEELSGLARGFAFRMVEALGILPRAAVAQEVKDLDQDARGALRKHGIRFGQFTIFMPLLLKPAPTRLRLVLWSLAQGLQEFPEAPPPGLVTVPAIKDAPQGYDTMSGYRDAGDRSIRIDMLERLADMLRSEDSRGGFEAKADMLSITGMTLEQFVELMQGLGYKAEKGERAKVKAAAETATSTVDATPEVDTAVQAETPAETVAAEVAEASAEPAPAEAASDAAEAPSAEAAAEMEVFYTFTWGRVNRPANRGPRRDQTDGARPQGKGKPRGKGQQDGGRGKPQGKKGGRPQQGAKTFSSRPARPEKKIDPDNPFAAALMGLKDGK
ncbi:disulfide oxidoreductase [Phaeobacter gallaeciensis]|uniref:Disulfide oxidoreductase n=1 Tax=Phaeobacter gallaeciensis TaxID=60890 RepID=A0A366WXQ1_9RHOB|nr:MULTISPECIES: helicase-related protein [Roseobacteraceae]MBT8170706.1 disulfide oxidoreductase [Falsiruegeria litorea]RBW52902.1 disulfide oxidoreductase [Phaeobacter gallaeciensis]